MAYDSDESGQREVYVRGFAPDRNPATGVGQWQISPAGGSKPRWSRDGRELFYIARDGKLMAVPVTSGTSDQHDSRSHGLPNKSSLHCGARCVRSKTVVIAKLE